MFSLRYPPPLLQWYKLIHSQITRAALGLSIILRLFMDHGISVQTTADAPGRPCESKEASFFASFFLNTEKQIQNLDLYKPIFDKEMDTTW